MKCVLIMVTSIFLLSCATAYKPKSFSGGFSETQLAENIFRVNFSGNGYTRGERAADFALLRSAELTLNHGFKYFVIIDESQSTSLSTYTTPTTSTTTLNANTYGNANVYGNTATYTGSSYGTARTTTYGGKTYLISKPSSSNTIVCLKEKPNEGFVYDAQFVMNSIKGKYGIK